jgi:hypothetical protein
MTGVSWLGLAGVLVCAALGGGCEFLDRDPLSWSSGIDLQFNIPDGQKYTFLQIQAPGPARFRPGTIFLQGANLKMNGAPQPKTLNLGLERHDPGLTESEFYEFHVPVRPNGRWKKKVPNFGGLNVNTFDFVELYVRPEGAGLPTGARIDGRYVYTPRTGS